jgi:hypothetical protein
MAPLPKYYLYTIIATVEKDKKTSDATAPTKQEGEWKNPTDSIMRPREMGHVFGGTGKSHLRHTADAPANSEALASTVDQKVWEMQRARAREIAIDNLELTENDLQKSSNKIRVNNLIKELLVITRDGSVVVGNNPEHAKSLRYLDESHVLTGTSD